MARYLQKRKRSSGSAYASKKRKTAYKRTKRKRITDFTSLATKGTSNGFRGRKTSRRQYKKWLWDSTLFATHYRSLFCGTGTIATPANNTDYFTGGLNLIRSANNFWTAAGGALPVDIGTPVPLFKGDIILRGGVWSVTFHNPAATDVVITCWECFTIADPNLALFPVSAVKGWDPSVSGDFSTLIGKTKSNRIVNLEGGNSYTISGRYRIQKIDEAVHALEGKTPWLFFGVGNIGTVVPVNVNYTLSYNLSFSADAIGTT